MLNDSRHNNKYSIYQVGIFINVINIINFEIKIREHINKKVNFLIYKNDSLCKK